MIFLAVLPYIAAYLVSAYLPISGRVVSFIFSIICWYLNYQIGKSKQVPDDALKRYGPFTITLFLLMIPINLLYSSGFLEGNIIALIIVVTVNSFIGAFCLSMGLKKVSINKKRFIIIIAIMFWLLVCPIIHGEIRSYNAITRYEGLPDEVGEREEIFNEEINYWEYVPFETNNKVKKFDMIPSLTFSSDFPRLDGATAAYPVYSAMAELLYKDARELNIENFVTCSKTAEAYERLINDEADVVFGVRPSEEQLELAKEKGVEFVLTPICKEAFVFFVNTENPINNLTVEEIRKIYTKKIKNWKKLGGEDERILPFQRPVNSGSQTIMINQVMNGLKMSKPLEEEVIQMMGGIIYQTASYRNQKSAIGYSFRFYATEMNPNLDIKFLSINGVESSVENIKNDSYPFISEVYAVTTQKSNEKENVQKLIKWILSDEGQSVIEGCGYVPLK